jgi:hypothetical protein
MSGLLVVVIDFVEQNLTNFNDLIMVKLVILIVGRHFKVTLDEVSELLHFIILHDDITDLLGHETRHGHFFAASTSA